MRHFIGYYLLGAATVLITQLLLFLYSTGR